jgi:hypothetical protein
LGCRRRVLLPLQVIGKSLYISCAVNVLPSPKKRPHHRVSFLLEAC